MGPEHLLKRICILGNSHLGALVQAEQGNARFADAGYDVLYWGAAGGNFPKIRYNAGIFTSPHPSQARMISGDRCEELAVANADVLIAYGCHVMLSTQTRRIAMILQEAEGISSAMRAAYLDEIVSHWWRNATIRPLIEAVRRDFPKMPIFLYAHPLEGKHGGYFARLRDMGLVREVFLRLIIHLETWAETRSVSFCRQPQETVVDDLFTDPVFARGSVKLGQDEQHPEGDLRHMNSSYGNLVMDQLFGLVDPLLKR